MGWGPLEKQLTYNILISDFVGDPKQWGDSMVLLGSNCSSNAHYIPLHTAEVTHATLNQV